MVLVERNLLYIERESSTARLFNFRDLASREVNRGMIVEIVLHFGSANAMRVCAHLMPCIEAIGTAHRVFAT